MKTIEYPYLTELLRKDQNGSFEISRTKPELRYSSSKCYDTEYKNLQLSLVKDAFALLTNQDLKLSSDEAHEIRFFAAKILNATILRFPGDINKIAYARQLLELTQATLDYIKESKYTARLKDIEKFEMRAKRVIEKQQTNVPITDVINALDDSLQATITEEPKKQAKKLKI